MSITLRSEMGMDGLVQPTNVSVQLVRDQPMEVSDTIVANRTRGMGDLSRESSEDNVHASVSWGRTDGLASDRAVTCSGIALSGVRSHHMNAVQVELEDAPSLLDLGVIMPRLAGSTYVRSDCWHIVCALVRAVGTVYSICVGS